MVDSYVSRRFPLFHLKIRADLAQFTTTTAGSTGGLSDLDHTHHAGNLMIDIVAVKCPGTGIIGNPVHRHFLHRIDDNRVLHRPAPMSIVHLEEVPM